MSKSNSKYKKVIVALKVIILLGLAVYLLQGVEVRSIVENVAQYSLPGIAVTMFPLILAYGLAGLRFHQLSIRQFGIRAGAESFLFAAAANNLLPARIGDILRLVYLKRVYNIYLRRSLPLTVIERSFDFTALLLVVSLAAISGVGIGDKWILLLSMVAVIITVGLLVKKFSPVIRKSIKNIPLRRVRVFVWYMLNNFKRYMTMQGLLYASISTVGIWLMYLASTGIFLIYVTKFDLDFSGLVIAFGFSVLGLAIPAAPAAAGTYHAGLVFGLVLSGIEKEEALSAAIILHLIKVLPPMLAIPYLVHRLDAPLFSLWANRRKAPHTK